MKKCRKLLILAVAAVILSLFALRSCTNADFPEIAASEPAAVFTEETGGNVTKPVLEKLPVGVRDETVPAETDLPEKPTAAPQETEQTEPEASGGTEPAATYPQEEKREESSLRPTEPAGTEPAHAGETAACENHVLEEAEYYPATCVREGFCLYVCRLCGWQYRQSLEANGHDWEHCHEDAVGYRKVWLECHCGWRTVWDNDDAVNDRFRNHVNQVLGSEGTTAGHSYYSVEEFVQELPEKNWWVCLECGQISDVRP